MPNKRLLDPIDVGLVVVTIKLKQCPTLQYQPAARESQRLWCDTCRWNYTQQGYCNIIARIQREQGFNRPQQYRPREGNAERALVPTYLADQEQARSVLGAQPPPPGTTPLRYANVESKEPNWIWYLIMLITTKTSNH